MAKSFEQILENHRQHAERSDKGLEIARATANTELAAFNILQGFKSRLMQGLIGWRCGIQSPVASFRDAVVNVRNGSAILSAMGSITTTGLPLEKASFLEFLVNESPIAFDLDGITADRLLDAVLGRGLQGNWDEVVWEVGLDQLRRLNGSSLAVETYLAYRRLMHSPQDSDVNAAADNAISLFERRRSNTFYSGGEQTEGGGNDNAITVDYRLAAIMKKIGYIRNSVHSWQWG